MRPDPVPNRPSRFSSTESSSSDGEGCGDGRGDDEWLGRGRPGFVGVAEGSAVGAGVRLTDLDAAVERDAVGWVVEVLALGVGAGVAVGATVEPGGVAASRVEPVRAGSAVELLVPGALTVPAGPVAPVGLCEPLGATLAST